MRFLGQPIIMRQLSQMLPLIYEEKRAANFMLRGPSGYGKTTLALQMCNYLAAGKFKMYLGDSFTLEKFNESYWVHFIDEIHGLKTPEILYPLMDREKYVIILASNGQEPIAEPLINRCYEFTLIPYDTKDLIYILKNKTHIKLPDEYLKHIIEIGNSNPRVCIRILQKLDFLISTGVDISTLDKFKSFVSYNLGIENSMDILSNRYLQVLTQVGGTASIQTLAALLHINKEILQTEVEPGLLYKNKISITSRGRSII